MGLAAVLLILLAQVAPAQTAILRGRVADQTGAIVTSAKVTLTSPSGQTTTVNSGTDGTFSISRLPPGTYSLEATAPGLSLRPIEITLQPGVQTRDLQLDVAVVSQQIAVEEAAGPALAVEPSANASATVLRGADLDSLADDPTDLAEDLQALAGPAAGPSGGEVFVDGFSGGEIPSKDSIREVRVNANPFSPEYDKLGLGRIEIFTKPGSDKFRGTAFYNFGDDAWNSRNPYAAQKAPFLLREYGGNVGGPLNRRASFFLDVRRDATDNGAIINGVMLDSRTSAPAPFTEVYDVAQRAIRVAPRLDLQLGAAHTLTLGYRFTQMDIPGAGIGGFSLPERGYDARPKNETAQISETAVLSPTTVHEARFQYFRSAWVNAPFSTGPAIQVLGSFSGGGNPIGASSDVQNSYEFQDSVTISRGKHVWRAGVRLRGQTELTNSPYNFNGTFTFSGGTGPDNSPITSIEQYRRGLPSQYSLAAGDRGFSGGQWDIGAFAGDDWRLHTNLTLSLGLRYETQSNIHDWSDFAPRVAVAWAPGANARKQPPKTVVRAGFGIFYDRFALANSMTAERYNGVTQQQYFFANPDFYPFAPPPAEVAALGAGRIEKVSSILRAPYILQSTAALERELPWKTKLAITYANSHGLHMLRSRDIGAPLPGTFDPSRQTGQTAVFLMESAGLYNQNQLLVNVTTTAGRNISLSGSYALNRAMSNTDGVNTFPANQYDMAGEYGPAATDVRHRISLNGSVNTRWHFSVSPFLVLQSGPPFNLTVGDDLYGTTLFNARPGFATDPHKPGVIATPYGLLDAEPTPGERIVPRNYGRGPGSILFNVRFSKTIGFGREKQDKAADGRTGGPPPHPYNLAISMAVRNIVNHNNPGPIIGNIASPLFGQANQPAGAGEQGGGGFSESANNRRLELQVRFSF